MRVNVKDCTRKLSSHLPWIFSELTRDLSKHEYEDISGDIPTPDDIADAGIMPETHQNQTGKPTHRHRTKKPRLDPSSNMPASSSKPPPGIKRKQEEEKGWWTNVEDDDFGHGVYWAEALAAVEICIELPSNINSLNKTMKEFPAYFVAQLKKRTVEVSEKRMNKEEYEQFSGAKDIEVRNFVASKAFEALPAHIRPSKEQAMRMRWILTWKINDDGTAKAKARAVILGYLDPDYEK